MQARACTSPPGGGCYRRWSGSGPPFWIPERPPLEALFASLAVSKIGTASRVSFGSTPLRHQTSQGAPEQVNYRVNSMSTISLWVRSGNAPGPLLDSQQAPQGTLFRSLAKLKKRYRFGRPPRWGPRPSVQAPWGYRLPLGPWLPALRYIYIYMSGNLES